MARPDKAADVAELVESFQGAAGAVLTEYRGLTVKQLQDLRRSLGENANYAVVKNTLAQIAAREAGIEGFDDLLAGPTAIAFIKGDAVAAAKSLTDFAKANKQLVIKTGYFEGKAMDAAQVAALAALESREHQLARVAGVLQAPASAAARIIEALRAKREEEGGAAPAEAAAEAPAEEAPAAEATEEA